MYLNRIVAGSKTFWANKRLFLRVFSKKSQTVIRPKASKRKKSNVEVGKC